MPMDPMDAHPLALACKTRVSTTLTHRLASSLLVKEVDWWDDDDTEATAVLDEEDFDWD